MATDEKYLPLEELSFTSNNGPIAVRVLRIWEARNLKRYRALMSLDFVLLDERNTAIQGSIPLRYIEQFREYIREGEVFVISNFDTLASSNRFKITDHDYTIRFKEDTTIKQEQDGAHSIQPEKFRFRKYADLLALADKGAKLPGIDGNNAKKTDYVIGFLCDNIPKHQDHIEGASRRLPLRLLLEDEVKVRITIWDDMVDAFYNKLANTQENTIVMIITSVNPKMFGRDLFLNTTSSTKFYLNSDFGEARQFRERKPKTYEIEITRGDSNNMQNRTSKKIYEILEFALNDKKQEAEFTCKAEVKGIMGRNGWNYIACSICAKKIEKNKTTLSCPNCRKPQAIGILRFRIEAKVNDGSATTTFVIFDRDAQKLLNKTASDIIDDEDAAAEERENQAVPECIRSIVGRTLNFQIKVTAFNFNAQYQSFTVSRVLDDSKIKKEEDASGNEDNSGGRKRERETELAQKVFGDNDKTQSNINKESIGNPHKIDVTDEEKSKEWNIEGSEKKAAQKKKIKIEDDSLDNKYLGLIQ